MWVKWTPAPMGGGYSLGIFPPPLENVIALMRLTMAEEDIDYIARSTERKSSINAY